jgi:hypothetical protein
MITGFVNKCPKRKAVLMNMVGCMALTYLLDIKEVLESLACFHGARTMVLVKSEVLLEECCNHPT